MVEKITLMDAYLLEHLRHADISDEDIKEKVRMSEAAQFKDVHDSFDFTMLHNLADRIDMILDDGYEVKFLTFNGLVNLLELKFNKRKTVDYDVNEFVISKLQLTIPELKDVKQMVSANWLVKEAVDGVMIEPVHKL